MEELPLSCANWLRQYLPDSVNLLSGSFGLDYRLAFGSVLGALRSLHDYVPVSLSLRGAVQG